MSEELSVRRRRRSWTEVEKREIVAETRSPGTSVSVVARRHDINANLLFKWKRQFETDGLGSSDLATATEFLPIGMFAASRGDAVAGRGDDGLPPSALASRSGVMEIDLACGARVRVGVCVDERALRRVVRALKPNA